MHSLMNTQDSLNAAGGFDQQKLSTLKKQISMSKSQLLQLAYDDEKFVLKLQQLNKLGFDAINDQNYNQAIIYLSEAENILEYAASCGKTIQRNLIVVILQNQACVYHRVWQLEKSINYIEAIIYNITSFLQNQKAIQLKLTTLKQNSDEYMKCSIYLKNKLQLVFYYLQFCAVSSQNQCHQNALSAASKALNILKEVCEQQYNLQRVARKNGLFNNIDEQHQQLLLELHNIKECRQDNKNQTLQKTIQKFLIKAKKTILKFKTKLPQNKQKYSKIQKQLQNYSIGYVMQINPLAIAIQPQMLNLQEEMQYIKKIYKAIYISISHFTMATELRLLSSEKFPIDQEMKKSSIQFKTSQLHHLIAIITAGLYVPCDTIYFEHILNSFKNHYGVDLSQKDSQISLTSQTWNQEDDDLIHLQTSSLNLKKQSNLRESHQDFSINNKMKNSKKNSQHNIQLGSPQLYGRMKKGMSKNKILSNKQSQKSLKSSAHQTNINTPLTFTVQRNKSKSKGKNLKKSNLKQSSKSRKKSRKVEQKVKSPSLHKNSQQHDVKKKVSDVKQKKLSDVKGSSRSKTKSRKKTSRSKHDLQDSKQKITHTKNYNNLIPHAKSGKKLITTQIQPSIKTQVHPNSIKAQKQYGLGKNLSNNVYIQRTNNTHGGSKQKKIVKNQHGPGNIGTSNVVQTDSITFKVSNIKKSKSPNTVTATTSISQKESRSLKKGLK